jgi:hypothetical protein
VQTLILDSSQISAWFECPQMWANRGLIAINKKDPAATNAPSDAISMGNLGHKYLELYYTKLAETDDGALAAATALRFDPVLEDPKGELYPTTEHMRGKVRQRFSEYLMFYADDYKPAFRTKKGVAVRDGLPVDTVVREPLIEKGFSYKLYESAEYLFVLEGRIDFIGTAKDGTYFWSDHKWQMREHTLYAKSIQFRNYALATGLNLAVINYIRLHDKIQTNTFVRQPLSFSSLEARYWKEELIVKYIEIAKQVREESFPRNRNSCSGSWGKPCMFTPLCEEYNLATRAAIQKRDFTARKEWRPW